MSSLPVSKERLLVVKNTGAPTLIAFFLTLITIGIRKSPMRIFPLLIARAVLILFAIGAIISLAACNNASNSTQLQVDSNKVLIPLNTTNSWVYKCSYIDGGLSKVDTVYVDVSARWDILGKAWYKPHVSAKNWRAQSLVSRFLFFPEGSDFDYSYYTNSSDGFVFGYTQDLSQTATLFQSILYAHAGRSTYDYIFSTKSSGNNSGKIRVNADSTKITVPAGQYNTIRYDVGVTSAGVQPLVVNFLRPGVGIVKSQDSSLSTIIELLSASIH